MVKKLFNLLLALCLVASLAACSHNTAQEEETPAAPTTEQEAIDQATEDASANMASPFEELQSVDELKASVQEGVVILAKNKVTVTPVMAEDEPAVMNAGYIMRYKDGSIADVMYFPENPGESFYVATLRQNINKMIDPKQDIISFAGDYNDYTVESDITVNGLGIKLHGTDEGIYLADWIDNSISNRYALIFSAPVDAGVVEGFIQGLYN